MNETILETIARLPSKPEAKLKYLPGETGFPLFGHTFQFLGNATKLMTRLAKQYGSVFYYNVLFNRSIVLADADAASLVLIDKAQNFSNGKGWYRMAPLFDEGILLRDFDHHKTHRRTLQQSFKSSSMTAYAERLNSLISKDISFWKDAPEFLFAPKIKTLLLDNAASLFLGAELGLESDKLNTSFVDLLGGLLAVFRTKIPGTAWHKSTQGKAYLQDWLYARVDERMAPETTNEAEDFFTSLCRESLNPEHPMSIDEVVEHTLLLLFAAHDTTTGTLSAIISLLCEHPEWQEKLRAEMQGIDAETLPFSRLGELTFTDWVFKEALRLYPPVFLIPRRAVKAFEYKGHKIPANSAIHLHVYLIHRSEAYWTAPNTFDPERFSPAREEHKGHRFQWIPFGAGAHTCLGIRFAETQVKTFLFHFLRNYRVETKLGRDTTMRTVPIPVPKDELPVTVYPL